MAIRHQEGPVIFDTKRTVWISSEMGLVEGILDQSRGLDTAFAWYLLSGLVDYKRLSLQKFRSSKLYSFLELQEDP